MNNLLETKKRKQIIALQIKLKKGDTKNVYQLYNKIVKLEGELKAIERMNEWNNFLSK